MNDGKTLDDFIDFVQEIGLLVSRLDSEKQSLRLEKYKNLNSIVICGVVNVRCIEQHGSCEGLQHS